MLAMGILGGIVNYLLSKEQTLPDLSNDNGKENKKTNTDNSLLKPLKETNIKPESGSFLTNILIGISATILVPLFLSTISSTLMEDALKSTIKYFVFAGFCLLAAIYSRKFIKSLEEQLLGKKVDDIAKNQKTIVENIETQNELAQSMNLIQSFKDHIQRLRAQISIRPEDLQDFPSRLKSALDQEMNPTEDSNIFAEAILLLHKARMCPMMNDLANEYKDKIKIKEVSWVTIALANLDFYEIVVNEQEKSFYKNTVINDCNKALELIPDYGEAIMTKMFLFAIDMLKANDDNTRETAKKEIENLFTTLLSFPNDVACYEATNAFERNNKEGIFLYSYLTNLQKEYPDKLEQVRIRGEKYKTQLVK